MGNVSSRDNRRFWAKVKKTNKCWDWLASKRAFGYGQFRFKNKIYSAHIFSWIIANKRKPKLCILHKCDNPSCVNPSHLYEGTKKQNTIDSVVRNRHYEKRKKYCENGHQFTKENTIIIKKKNGVLGRRCRICNKKWCLNYYYKNK